MQRTVGDGHVNNRFVHEDPLIDQAPTEITAAWLNAVQEELVTIVHGADMVLNPDNNGQVFSAITALINAAVVGGTVSEAAKWAAMPIGHAQPFIPSVFGVSISTWLADHPSWRKMDNSYVPDIEGRAMAIASASRIAGTQAGSDDAVSIDHGHSVTNPAHNHAINDAGHTHAITDPGHTHAITDPGHVHDATFKAASTGPVGSGSSLWFGDQGVTTGASVTGVSVNNAAAGVSVNNAAAGVSSIAATTAVTVSNSGVSGVNKNIQRTQYLDWIIKIS